MADAAASVLARLKNKGRETGRSSLLFLCPDAGRKDFTIFSQKN